MAETTVTKQTYYRVTWALMGLLVLTVAANYLPLGALGVLVALAIASAKAAVIILYFMHVKFSSKMTWLFAGAGFFWLLIMFVLTFTDYLTRDTIAVDTNVLP